MSERDEAIEAAVSATKSRFIMSPIDNYMIEMIAKVAIEEHETAMLERGRLIPIMKNCGTYFAKDNTGQWHYLNHANTWQTCPPPFPAPSPGDKP